MRQTISIMDVPIDYVTMEQAVDRVCEFLQKPKCDMVFTPNPEIIMEAQEDKELMHILKEASMVVPDGIGVVLASRILDTPNLPERVAGYDMVQNVFRKIAKEDIKVYFLGSKPTIAKKAAQNMKKIYPGIKIVGMRDGYFKQTQEQQIIEEINELDVDLLLVGLGAPRQEKWIYKYKEELNAKVCVGVGGSFDGMAGEVKRAPVFFQKLGLEWFYRLITQPTRSKRMLRLPVFGWRVLRQSKRI